MIIRIGYFMVDLLYFTFFKLGFARFAAGLAFLVADAKIAPAAFMLTPSLRAICFCAALNPMPLCAFISYLLLFAEQFQVFQHTVDGCYCACYVY